MIVPSGLVMHFAFITIYAVSVVDVVLDRDTAHPNIVLSADGKQAGRGELLQIVPDNPQRFDPVICVVAKQGFLSGRFYFQVRLFVHLPRVDCETTLIKVYISCFALHHHTGCRKRKDLLGPWSGQRVCQQEGDDHRQARERVLDNKAEKRERIPSTGLTIGPPIPFKETSDYWGVYRL